MDLVLASASQRRQDLLTQFGYDFRICVSNVEEQHSGDPVTVVEHNALAKASSIVFQYPDSLIIGADTIVVFRNQILGKPANWQQAMEMLQILSGQEHEVITAVALCAVGAKRVFHKKTKVLFRQIKQYEIEGYIQTSEPYDKAGSYGIQGIGGSFVESIIGCYYNVVGLPMPQLILELRAYGLDIFAQGEY